MNLRERARWQDTGPQTACRCSGDGGLPVRVVRVNARTALIAPTAVVASAVPGGPASTAGVIS